jgi:hypothetical protein
MHNAKIESGSGLWLPRILQFTLRSFRARAATDGRDDLRLVSGAGVLGVLVTNESSRRTTRARHSLGSPSGWAACGLLEALI